MRPSSPLIPSTPGSPGIPFSGFPLCKPLSPENQICILVSTIKKILMTSNNDPSMNNDKTYNIGDFGDIVVLRGKIDGDLWILMTEFRCWGHILNVGVRLLCKKIVDVVAKWSKPSPTTNYCHQHMLPPIFVTNIDVTILSS